MGGRVGERDGTDFKRTHYLYCYAQVRLADAMKVTEAKKK